MTTSTTNGGLDQTHTASKWGAASPIPLALVFLGLGILYAPILYDMVLHWKVDSDYSYGFIIAPLALYFAWPQFKQIPRQNLAPSWWGVLPLTLSTISLTLGRLGGELMTLRVSFVLALIGLVILLLGIEIFRRFAFPLCFLFLMIPLPASVLNVIAFPLQLFAADRAVDMLYLMHIPALREGNIIHLPETTLFVEQACSGLRSLMALVTLGVIFAYFFRKRNSERVVLVLSTIPIAVLVNAFRVMLTGALTYKFGEQMAEGFLHEFQGLITFGLAFLLLLTEARVLGYIFDIAYTKGRK